MNSQKISRIFKNRKHGLSTALLAIMAHFLMLPHAGATSICRWVDENGQVQFSDVVPDRYTNIVTCTHSQPIELSVEQRAANERAKRRTDKISSPATAASSAAPLQSIAPQPDAKQPAERITDSTDCPTWRRLYDESGACFAPFRTAGGGVKAEAFDKCNEVPSPEAKCGPERN